MKTKREDAEVHFQYAEEIQEKLKNDTFAQWLGIELTEIGPGTAIAEMKITENMLNAHGTAHGAALFAIADFVFAVACNSYGKTSVGLSVNIGYLAACQKGDKITAIASEIKRNHRTSWYEVRVENGKELVAHVSALSYRKNDYFVGGDE
ncbi:phenylacetate degradation protein [Fictibacillus phosphorivorans]|uniref:Phenylacetate degradation protein n=1 Tax=Fictibacillus phosphorivorans TaxID=1221500 RepID=A0A163SKH0_9BACL|nr:hotdog fold thioesterase [Fictibacillus phosphorivorans]KZE69307.1 phenylacetate degradation protein [Fictibacillus phosphorivorans]